MASYTKRAMVRLLISPWLRVFYLFRSLLRPPERWADHCAKIIPKIAEYIAEGDPFTHHSLVTFQTLGFNKTEICGDVKLKNNVPVY
jgi:hypothetical protein